MERSWKAAPEVPWTSDLRPLTLESIAIRGQSVEWLISLTTPDGIDASMNVNPFSRIPERILPGRTDRAETADHMASYRIAATPARGRTLDLGAGVGYGASN